ncbi:hypothetical protein FocTR4_00011346 [Fusarium oxysporum f. sp. cubense]|uniref:Uncharacterized protein n=1 Tax=Fusarium oxysporum f. sp. cubense TaxID=61366 RepID=A0A5C6SHM5_FUSOC|nr:hypothetical protein FocTR4_00011346 [Fusarium oxysporum f. sp. cubense]
MDVLFLLPTRRERLALFSRSMLSIRPLLKRTLGQSRASLPLFQHSSHATQQERVFHLTHCIQHWASKQRYLIAD